MDDSYKFLNRVAEGTYGVVFRAEDKKSGEICALKRLKMEKEREGFPITSLREIVTLLKGTFFRENGFFGLFWRPFSIKKC